MEIQSVKNKVLLIENYASDFYGARLPLAKSLVSKGWDVYAMIPSGSEYVSMIQQQGIQVIQYDLDRKNKGFSQLYQLLKTYRRIIKEHDFKIVHSFRFQPNLINALSGIGKKHRKVLHITGLGIAFSNPSIKYRVLKFISQIVFLIKLYLADLVIVQNPNDIDDIWASNPFKRKIRLIYGSGIDVHKYSSNSFERKNIRRDLGIHEEQKLFICVTRLIWEKGLKELVDAFTLVNAGNKNFILYIVGWSDYDNPRHVTDQFINSVTKESGINFLGKRTDIPQLLAASDIFIFPSYYREGIPRSLLEALSMGLPIITTDMPGCKMTVANEVNGLIIQPRSVEEIINAVNKILHLNILEMGKRSRELAIEEFQDKIIFQKILDIYNY
jgi:glycosyltransferase involved in cell wall biosynthesis